MPYISLKDERGQEMRGIVFPHCQWNNLYETVNKAKEIEEEVQAKAAELEQRRELSKKMADTWENTYINIRKQRFEKRKERLMKEQKYKEKRYEELRIESEKVKQKIKEKAKDAFFFERDACKSFHSAYRNSEVEAERLAQLEFNEKLKKIDRDIETKYAESILNDVQRFHEEQEKEKREIEEKKKQLKIEAKEMFKEAEAKKKNEKERLKKEEKEDMDILARQLQQVIENEKAEKQRKKLFERQNLMENRKLVKQFKSQLKEEDMEEDKALEIIANGKITMAKIRQQKEKEMLTAKHALIQAMTNKLSNEADERQRREGESLRKAEEEKYKIEIDKKEKERQFQEMLKQERIDEHLKYLKAQEEKLLTEKELLKWDILKRLEREEINNQFTNKIKTQKRNRAQYCRTECVKQVEMDIDKRMKEKQLELEACQRSQELWELSDKEFLEYALSVREESRKKGRPLYPLDAAIYNYKKNHGLIDRDRNFIWDSKIKRPEGIKTNAFDGKEEGLENKEQNCLTVQTLSTEDCGCPKKANGLM